MRFAALLVLAISLSACATQKVCFDCTTKKQEWKSSPFPQMTGRWRGGIEIVGNSLTAKKKERREDPVNLVIVSGADFLSGQKMASCERLPVDSIVLMGQLWTKNSDKSFDVFAATANGDVAYGKAQIKSVNGKSFCEFTRIGGDMAQNRQWLPSLTFTERRTNDGRVLASGSTPEEERVVEILHFSPKKVEVKEFPKQGRRPAAAQDQDKPPLMIRVYRTVRNIEGAYANGKWQESQEYIYRLWRAN